MAVVYIITNTEGSDEFAIQPQTLNGPGGLQQNTDLRLPGNGLAIWGEAYNENIYRLTESFAIPEKELNDFNPLTGLFDYDPTTDPILPKDENDLGAGNGINVPLEGQIWWNKTQSKLFVFDSVAWAEPNVVGSGTTAEVPGSCTAIGDMFFDTDIEQLLVCDGSNYVSVADRYLLTAGGSVGPLTMAGDIDMDNTFRVINLPPPATGTDAVNRDYVDDNFVELVGDTMLGDLILNADPAPQGLGNGTALQAATKNYVDVAVDGLFLEAVTGDVRMTIDATNPLFPAWLPLRGETMSSGVPAATYESGTFGDLFDLVKLLPPNTGAEVFGVDDVVLPDMRARSPMAPGGGRNVGDTAGTESETLSIAQMPSHTHDFLNVTGGPFSGGGGFAGGFSATSSTGGGAPHNNLSPIFVLNFLIKV